MKRIILIGASGHGKVCGEIAELSGYDEILFLDDNVALKDCGGYPVVGAGADFERYIREGTDFFVSIGNTNTRKQIQEKITASGGNMAMLIHPKSVIGKDIEIGAGCVVMAGVVINPGTEIGNGVIINTSSSVDHDCKIGAYCHIAVGAHICGGVNIDEETWIGAGAVVNNYLYVCSGCIIGAGAVVVKDIIKSGTYVGVPAKQV